MERQRLSLYPYGNNDQRISAGVLHHMLVRHLSYFATLASEGHFARAADLCHISQPTLSAAIRKLEEDLGTLLVVRNHRYLGLTVEGEKVLSWSRQILADYHSLRDDLAGLPRGMTGTLRLGVIPAAMPMVARLTECFSTRHPAATIDIQSMTSRAIQRALDTFELDGGMTYLENEPLDRVRRISLYRERYVFVVRPEHPAAGRSSITWAEAAAHRLCLLSADMQNRRILDNLTASINVTIKPEVVSNSFLAICAHLRRGGWASIVPHTFLTVFGGAPDLVAIDLVEPRHSQAIGLVLSDRDPPSPMSEALLASVVNSDLEADLTSASRTV